MDDHAHAYLPVSRGYLGRVTMVGGGEFVLCTQPPCPDSDWNDCAQLCMRFRWSSLVTHDLNKKKQVKPSLKLTAELIVWPQKTVHRRAPNCTTVKGVLKIERWAEAHLQSSICHQCDPKKEGTSAEQPKWVVTQKYLHNNLAAHVHIQKNRTDKTFFPRKD